jgi:hypothetical protein
VEVAKLYHFEYDPHGFFRWEGSEEDRDQWQSKRNG